MIKKLTFKCKKAISKVIMVGAESPEISFRARAWIQEWPMDPNSRIRKTVSFSSRNEVFERGGLRMAGLSMRQDATWTILKGEPPTLTEVVDFVVAVNGYLIQQDDISQEARETFTLAKKKMAELIWAERDEIAKRRSLLHNLEYRLDQTGL